MKKLIGKPTITVSSVGDDEFASLYSEGKGVGIQDIHELLKRLDNNEFDLVAVGRALLADPAWARKIREGGWMKSVLLFRTLFILCFNMEALRHTGETVIPLTDVFGLLFHFGAIS